MNEWLRLERLIRLILTTKWDRWTWPIAKNVLGVALRLRRVLTRDARFN